MNLAVLIPVFNEAETLKTLAEGVFRHTSGHRVRLLFIDDGSTDGSLGVLEQLVAEHASVEVIKFRRNCGKTQALAAGFARLEEDVVITMDADLQDDPAEIPRLLGKLEEGYDMVCGWKAKRQDPVHKTLPSRVYNGFIAALFGLHLHDVNTGFKALRVPVAKRLPLNADLHRLIPVLAHLMGYRVTEIAVEHHPRRFGQSKYGWERFYEGLRDATRVWVAYRLLGRGLPMPTGGEVEVEAVLVHEDTPVGG
ncbi:MAG: glycosyltransferase family 2 protein [Candidatus Hydrogenedentes bacterium]|nr:glycosyltransferase family 2 protein [Candidatus Hydrogenedentota bacterium]